MARTAKSVNYWPDSACAKAFWSQHELPPYQELLAHTPKKSLVTPLVLAAQLLPLLAE